MGSKELSLRAEKMLVLSVRPSVDAQQQRNFGALNITNWICKKPVYVGTIFGFELDLFSGAQIKFCKQRIVLMSQLFDAILFKNINLAAFCITTRQDDGASAGRV